MGFGRGSADDLPSRTSPRASQQVHVHSHILTPKPVEPRRIFGLPAQSNTRVKVEPNARFVLGTENLHTKCGWTPFKGMPVRGKVRQVVLRGQTAYEDGTITAKPGYGRVIMPVKRTPARAAKTPASRFKSCY